VRVFNHRRAGLSIHADKAIGSTLYALIDGRRLHTRAGGYIALDAAAIIALRKEPVIYISWNDLGGAQRDHSDILAGFGAAYDECVSHMEGRPPAVK
jgi:hypothetical protein